ncbi:TY-Chap2 family putative peptide chaperone [Kocuria sp. KH4]
MKLTGPQQDRAAGLLVGMAVGDAHSRFTSDAASARHTWGPSTSTTRAALDVLTSWPGAPATSCNSITTDLARVRADALLSAEDADWVAATARAPLAIAAAVSLTTLGEVPHRIFDLARSLAGETFDDALAMACGIWSVMLAETVRSGDADLRKAAALSGEPACARWTQIVDEVQASHPMDVAGGNLSLDQIQKAWSVVAFAQHTPGPQRFLRNVSVEALRYYQAESVGALVGATLGAARGFSAIPFAWRRDLTGPTGGTADELMRSAITVAFGRDLKSDRWPNAVRMDYSTWPARNTVVNHPADQGVQLGGVGALETMAPSAAVSLCRLGTAQRPASVQERDHASFWLVDSDQPADNPNLSFVLEDAANTVKLFRAERKRVLLHCVQAQGRTPAVAALYGRLITGEPAMDQLAQVVSALPPVHILEAFARELRNHSSLPAQEDQWYHQQGPRRHVIEAISWSVAAELLRLHPDAWLEVATEGSGAHAQQFEVAFPGQGYVGFRRSGSGIVAKAGFRSSWPEAVMSGDVHGLVLRIEQAMGLVRPPAGRTLSAPARLAALAAAVVTMSYGTVQDIALAPSPRWEGDYLHGTRPTEQQVHIGVTGHHIEARDDGTIRVDSHLYALPTTRPAIQQVAQEILQALGVLTGGRHAE